jgi:hypothetical protein
MFLMTKVSASIGRYYPYRPLRAHSSLIVWKKETLMKIKLLSLCALIFLLLGWNTKDGVLFFFFAVHLLTLAIGAVVSKYDEKRHPVLAVDTLPEIDTTESS